MNWPWYSLPFVIPFALVVIAKHWLIERVLQGNKHWNDSTYDEQIRDPHCTCRWCKRKRDRDKVDT